MLPVAASVETENVLSHHKFAVGQMVDFLPGQGDTNVPRGKYKVLRLLPSETRDLQYRVKHAVDGHERVVTESRLAARHGLLG
jgi:hypothetical protein